MNEVRAGKSNGWTNGGKDKVWNEQKGGMDRSGKGGTERRRDTKVLIGWMKGETEGEREMDREGDQNMRDRQREGCTKGVKKAKKEGGTYERKDGERVGLRNKGREGQQK